MKNNTKSSSSGIRSIRGVMLWVPVVSFVLAVLLYLGMDTLTRYQFGFVFSNYVSLPIFFGLFFGLFFLFTRRIVTYFKEITDGLNQIAGGNLEFRLPLTRQDQLGSVAQNINYMAEQLQRQLERERQLEKSKMELITHVSHDLRTPLTSVIGYLDLLKSHAVQDEQEQERFIGNAYHKTQQLKKLIDDLFEYTRLTGGDIQLFLETIEINKLLAQMISEFEPVAGEHRISIEKNLFTKPFLVNIDVEKMVRAFDNLLINALKYSRSPGEIRIGLFAEESHVKITFENEGSAITPEEEARLFERFFKLELKETDQRSLPAGAGLGLTIAKQIVEMNNGTIGVIHDAGRYIFWIKLPIVNR
ncbi:HAMP domain-containing sensor histidine kinase [Paenibacillus sp. FJAT-27812]|uniref:HAMP domain-containing sensor histidine kinase n=1 Tax=Paenibacillus sp. FJAT-27812 TaxID=1684143 RepID=UPI0006A7D5E3|nr:HAMP domain-containing sensor histidine kinase [Paenibacillus sp. FJAT-27812]